MPKRAEAKVKGVKSDYSIDELFGAASEEEAKTARLVRIAQEQIKTSMEHKRVRMDEVAKSEDLYFGKTKKALKGRWNVPLPIMSGYVDELLSKTDDPPKIKYGWQDAADMKRASKVQAKWEQDSTAVTGRWAYKDRLWKKIASFYGVGIGKYFAYNDDKGKYCSHFEIVDPLDFECEPMGGQMLPAHTFKGQRNIFRSRTQLINGAKEGSALKYDKKQVLRLFATVGSDEYKKFERIYREKTERMRALGFDPDRQSYLGVPTYNLTEWYMIDPETGENWYLFFEPIAGIAVRSCPLKEKFESDADPFVAWHTHPDPFNFWSKAPADDMRPIAEGMNVIFNQALDNREKKNYGQRAYDPAVFPDPSQLEWRPDGLVEVAEGISNTQAIGNGIYKFSVEDMPEGGTINLLQFMDSVAGLKTGVNATSIGEQEDKRVGIYYGNLQQVADRLGLYNKSYSEAWGQLGLLYYFGLREHIQTNEMMVRMIGSRGYSWEKLIKDDTDPVQEFNIEIVGGQAQAQLDEILKKTKKESLDSLLMNPTLVSKMNPDVVIEEVLRNGGWEDATVKRLTNLEGYGSEELVSEAHQAIEDILEGKEPKLNRGATALFMQTIVDFAYDTEDLPLAKFRALLEYAQAHRDLAIENMMRTIRLNAATEASALLSQGGGGAPKEGSVPPNAAVKVPGSPTVDALGFTDTPLNPRAAEDSTRAAQLTKVMTP